MSKIYYISDCHFFHHGIIRLCDRPFRSVYEMNKVMVDNWNNQVNKEDIVYIIGDLCYGRNINENDMFDLVKSLNGIKHLIPGNHDRKQLKNKKYKSLFASVNEILSINDSINGENKRIILCHYPMIEWDGYFRNALHLYGHTHNNKENQAYTLMRMLDKKENAMSVSTEILNYTPQTLDGVIMLNKIFNQ